MDDLIRRQDAIKAVESLPNCYNGFSDTYDKACFIGLLEEVPATSTCDFWDSESNYCALYRPFAQPERKKGKWIKNEERFGWHCSECKVDNYYAYVLNSETGKNDLQDRYCPHCGADMRGEINETD